MVDLQYKTKVVVVIMVQGMAKVLENDEVRDKADGIVVLKVKDKAKEVDEAKAQNRVFEVVKEMLNVVVEEVLGVLYEGGTIL